MIHYQQDDASLIYLLEVYTPNKLTVHSEGGIELYNTLTCACEYGLNLYKPIRPECVPPQWQEVLCTLLTEKHFTCWFVTNGVQHHFEVEFNLHLLKREKVFFKDHN